MSSLNSLQKRAVWERHRNSVSKADILQLAVGFLVLAVSVGMIVEGAILGQDWEPGLDDEFSASAGPGE